MDIKDPIVESVVEIIIERSNEGIETYGTTLADNKSLDVIDWIKNAQEEAIDMVLYLEKLKREVAKEVYLEKSLSASLEAEKYKNKYLKDQVHFWETQTEYWQNKYENLKQLNNK